MAEWPPDPFTHVVLVDTDYYYTRPAADDEPNLQESQPDGIFKAGTQVKMLFVGLGYYVFVRTRDWTRAWVVAENLAPLAEGWDPYKESKVGETDFPKEFHLPAEVSAHIKLDENEARDLVDSAVTIYQSMQARQLRVQRHQKGHQKDDHRKKAVESAKRAQGILAKQQQKGRETRAAWNEVCKRTLKYAEVPEKVQEDVQKQIEKSGGFLAISQRFDPEVFATDPPQDPFTGGPGPVAGGPGPFGGGLGTAKFGAHPNECGYGLGWIAIGVGLFGTVAALPLTLGVGAVVTISAAITGWGASITIRFGCFQFEP